MKKLSFICIVIPGLIFAAGCIGGEKTNSDILVNSQSSKNLIDPDYLLEGYHSSSLPYTTCAISRMVSFDAGFELEHGIPPCEEFEGNIPDGMKRILTTFGLTNVENRFDLIVYIVESDSNSKFRESFFQIRSKFEQIFKKKKNVNMETDLIGDYSVLYFGINDNNKTYAVLEYSHKNYLVEIITTQNIGGDAGLFRDETLKVGIAIKSKLN